MTQGEKRAIRYSLYQSLQAKAKDNKTSVLEEAQEMIKKLEKSNKMGCKEYTEILKEIVKDEELKKIIN